MLSDLKMLYFYKFNIGFFMTSIFCLKKTLFNIMLYSYDGFNLVSYLLYFIPLSTCTAII